MRSDDIYPRLTRIFNEAFFRDDIVLTHETSAETLEGWDSYRHVEILFAVEEDFGIKMSSIEIERLKNVGDLVALIAAKTGG